MIVNIEPQQMLYVTAIVALYGAVLSTLNFFREQKRDEIRLTVTTKDSFVDPPFVEAKLIEVINNSSFEIEISSLGFMLNSQDTLVFMPDSDHWYRVPDDIPSKKLRSYPIRTERISNLLISNGIDTGVSLKPFVSVNGKRWCGRPFLFDPEINVSSLQQS